jgi:phosphatidylserine/phosphatidylglycerophosphate/cardiolipin synthase-like enzyme
MLFEKERSYSGPSSYKFVDNLIKKSKGKLLIVSPFIDKYYARFLLNMTGGKNIYVVTSNSGGNKDAINLLRKASIEAILESLIVVILFDIIMFYFRLYTVFLIVNIPFFAMWFLTIYRRRKILSKIHIKVITKQFVHEKLYISDTQAIVGSANLTYKGMHSNIEHIEITDELKRIKEFKKHFDQLWNGL